MYELRPEAEERGSALQQGDGMIPSLDRLDVAVTEAGTRSLPLIVSRVARREPPGGEARCVGEGAR